jgi:small nuclear ribonucleoprotein (snRNP)-like protein
VSVPTATRRMFSELNALLDKEVILKLKNGKTLRGTLHGFDHSLNILLKNASEDDQSYPIILVYADSILSLGAAESPLFNPEEFAKIVSQKLNIRETDIKVFPEAGVVVVLNNIRISEKGVEGSGPLAHKIYGLFTEYIEAKKQEARK